jgi:hypothetical protein
LGLLGQKVVTLAVVIHCFPTNLFAMKELLESCPKLCFLSLPLDARIVDNIPNIPTTPPLRHWLRE